MAKYPEVQQKVYEEAVSVLGDSIETPITLRFSLKEKLLDSRSVLITFCPF